MRKTVPVSETPSKLWEKRYQRYLSGSSWCCPDAPIDPAIPLQVERGMGAHHWVELTGLNPNSGDFYCLYCHTVRKFRTILYSSDINWHDREAIYNTTPVMVDPESGRYRPSYHQTHNKPCLPRSKWKV